MQSLPPNEASVNFVPVLHVRLAEFPAVEDIAAIDLPAKIDQSRVHPFADDAEVVQLGDVAFDIARKSLRFDLKEVSDHVGVLGTRSYCRKLELADFLLPRSVIADEILDDPFNERQSSIGFFDGEDLFHARTVCGADCGSSALRLATRWLFRD